MIYNEQLLLTCDKLSHRCSSICGTYHGSAWLYDKLMRFFSASGNSAVVSITIPCYIANVGEGTAEIGRDGSLIMRLNH